MDLFINGHIYLLSEIHESFPIHTCLYPVTAGPSRRVMTCEGQEVKDGWREVAGEVVGCF